MYCRILIYNGIRGWSTGEDGIPIAELEYHEDVIWIQPSDMDGNGEFLLSVEELIEKDRRREEELQRQQT